MLSNVEEVYNDTLSRLIVIATHMHAGDGNVHVNIPVFSNDKEMLARAHMTADKVMAKAVALMVWYPVNTESVSPNSNTWIKRR